jgi:hypothetical protein
MAKLTKEEAFAAAFEIKAVIREKQKLLDTAKKNFPNPDRVPADVRGNIQKWSDSIELLTPALAFLEEKAGRAAPTL